MTTIEAPLPIAFTIDRALTDRNLLGASLGDSRTWETWFAVLKAAFGLHLNRQERRAFEAVAKRTPPQRRVQELWAIVGRRSGKSRMAAAIAIFLALFNQHKLSPGEVGVVLVLAASQSQARTVFGYALGFLQASPILAHEIDSVTAHEIRLRNGVVVAIHPASFRTVRGRTIIGAVFDEAAFWRDEQSANPDLEVYRAVLPSLASTGGMLVGISSPYRKIGLLHTKHRDYFGTDDADVLVVQGDSKTFNPTLNDAIIAQARASDPEAALSEWDGEFRTDLSSYLDDALIEAAVDNSRPLELPPRSDLRYVAATDASGGRHDAFTLCIGHREGERFIADVVRAKRPPFDPRKVVEEYSQLVREYGGCRRTITGDNYSAEWVKTAFEAEAIKYERSDLSKSDLYLEAIPAFTRQLISIPPHAQLIKELRLLERRTSRQGRDLIDHPRNASDDCSNSLVLALRLATLPSRRLIVGAAKGCY